MFAYWYAAQVLDLQLSCLDELIPGLEGKLYRVYAVSADVCRVSQDHLHLMNTSFGSFS